MDMRIMQTKGVRDHNLKKVRDGNIDIDMEIVVKQCHVSTT